MGAGIPSTPPSQPRLTEPTWWREEGKDRHLPFSPRSRELRFRGSQQTCSVCIPGPRGWPQTPPCPWDVRRKDAWCVRSGRKAGTWATTSRSGHLEPS